MYDLFQEEDVRSKYKTNWKSLLVAHLSVAMFRDVLPGKNIIPLNIM
jgi:hypothetical protein